MSICMDVVYSCEGSGGINLMRRNICPCSCMEVHPSQGWPLAVRNGPDVENWLGKKVRQEIRSLPIYFVPKRLKGRNLSEEAKGRETSVCLLYVDSSKCDTEVIKIIKKTSEVQTCGTLSHVPFILYTTTVGVFVHPYADAGLFCLSVTESWRISFSHIEKKIITSHGNKKTCCESNATKCCR